MLPISSYRVAIFDCDGVILASNKLKSEAFALALSNDDPELVKEFVLYHKKNGGISRYIKFEHYFKNIKKQTDYSKAIDLALDRYSFICRNGLMKCLEVPGVRATLKFLNSKRIPCFVVSGGDQKEVQGVFKERGLSAFFEEILGSPLSKTENLSSLKSKNRLEMPGIYFGDARSDMEAAKSFGLDFVFVAGISEWSEGRSVCKKENIPTIENFEGFIDGDRS